ARLQPKANSKSGKVKLIMRTTKLHSPNPKGYSLGHSLAHIFYPHNFPKIIASGTHGNSTQSKFRVTYSKKINLTEESQKGIEGFYKKNLECNDGVAHYEAHQKKLGDSAFCLADKIYQESGVFPNPRAMNAGKSKKNKIVYFEINFVYLPRAISFVEKMPKNTPAQKLRKKQATVLLEELKKIKNSFGFAKIHPQN
ncbi:MAG: hypothetical protein WCI04_01800, partial [archaeon]